MHSELSKFPALLLAAGPVLAIGMNIYYDHGPLVWFSLQSSQAKMGYENNSFDRCVLNHTVGQSTLTEDTDAVNSPLSTDDASGHPTEDIDEDDPPLQTSRAFVYVPVIFYGLGLLPFRSQRHLPAATSVQVSTGLSESVAQFDGDDSLEISLPSATSVRTVVSLSRDHLAWVSDMCAEHLGLHNCLDWSLHVDRCSVQSFLGSDHWMIRYLQSENAVSEQSYHVWVGIPVPTLDLGDLYLDALRLSEGPSVSVTVPPTQQSDKEVFSMSTRRVSPVASVLMPASLSEVAITVTCIVLCALVYLLGCAGHCYQRFGRWRVDQEAHPRGSLVTITPDSNNTALPTDDEDTVWDEHSDKLSVALTCASTEREEQAGYGDDQSWADADASLAVVVQEDCSFDSDHTLVAEDSLSGVLDSELKLDTEVNLTYDSDLSYPKLSVSPLSATNVLDPSAVRNLNKNAAVFVPKAHRTRLEGPTVDNGQRCSGKENRVVLSAARARTAMFIAAARAACSSRKNPFRGIRRKGLRDFDVEEDFCLPVDSSVGFRPSLIEPLVPVWDLNYSFLSPYVPIQSSRSMDTFRIPPHEQHGIPRAQSVHSLSTLQMGIPGSAAFEEAPRSSLSMDIPDSAAFEEQSSLSSSRSLSLLQSFRTMDDLMFIQDLPVRLSCTKSMGDLSHF